MWLLLASVCRWVYPRVCGGTEEIEIRFSNAKGLSPRVRGNPGGANLIFAPEGSIPACAGEPGLVFDYPAWG